MYVIYILCEEMLQNVSKKYVYKVKISSTHVSIICIKKIWIFKYVWL